MRFLVITNLRIDNGVKNIYHDIGRDNDQGGQHNIGHNHRLVRLPDRCEQKIAHSRPLKNRFGDDRKGDEFAELKAGNRDDRN